MRSIAALLLSVALVGCSPAPSEYDTLRDDLNALQQLPGGSTRARVDAPPSVDSGLIHMLYRPGMIVDMDSNIEICGHFDAFDYAPQTVYIEEGTGTDKTVLFSATDSDVESAFLTYDISEPGSVYIVESEIMHDSDGIDILYLSGSEYQSSTRSFGIEAFWCVRYVTL